MFDVLYLIVPDLGTQDEIGVFARPGRKSGGGCCARPEASGVASGRLPARPGIGLSWW